MRVIQQGVLVDSGAGAKLADGSIEFPEFPLETSEGSLRGQTCQGPGGDANVVRKLGQRRARLRFGQPLRQQGEVTFQEAKIRRPIMSVGESTEAGNSFWFDEEESVILPRGAKEQAIIRDLVKKAIRKLTMRKDRKVFRLDAWVELPEAEDNRFFTR